MLGNITYNINTPSKFNLLYLDMDGVLADFNQMIISITGKSPSQQSKADMWKAVKSYNNTKDFFLDIPVMKDAKKLIKFASENVYETCVLTACGYTPRDSTHQKYKWIYKNFPELVGGMEVVLNGKDKARWANHSTILIDDRPSCIDSFVGAGGVGILHHSVDESIAELHHLLWGIPV